MINELHIQGFRRFADYRMKDLARVNLLTGDNNCGKTTVLEGLHFLLAPHGRTSLGGTSWRRGEILIVEPNSGGNGRAYPTLLHHFHGHHLSVGTSFRISGNSATRVLHVVKPQDVHPRQMIEPFIDLGVRITNEAHPDLNDEFGISTRGAFSSTRFERRDVDAVREQSPRVNMQLGEISGVELRSIWDVLNAERRESEVTNALQIIDPDITDLYFETALSDISGARLGTRFGYRGNRERLPIGVLGDGIIRLVGLGAALAYCRGGTFLIDEIDTGLHWSIMGDLWKFVIETSIQNETQVFATTHSFDCLRGLDWACSSFPHLAEQVAVHTIKARLDEAISVPGSQLPAVMNQEIEVR